MIGKTARVEMSSPPFAFSCDSSDWFPEYSRHYASKLLNGVGFFHLHEWLKDRNIESQHRIVWAGWMNARLWLCGHMLMLLFPWLKKNGRTEAFWD